MIVKTAAGNNIELGFQYEEDSVDTRGQVIFYLTARVNGGDEQRIINTECSSGIVAAEMRIEVAAEMEAGVTWLNTCSYGAYLKSE